MNVNQATKFRKLCRENNVTYIVIKNTLTKIAVRNAGYDNVFDDILEGQIGTVTTIDDSIAPARIIKNFSLLVNNGNHPFKEVSFDFLSGSVNCF